MSRTFVALDVELTSLLSGSVAIVDVAVVRFHETKVLDTWQSFVQPAHSQRVQGFLPTGISEQDLATAPLLEDVLPALSAFVRDDVLIGASIEAGLRRLREGGFARSNTSIDLLELANVLVPGLPTYTLSSVGNRVGIARPRGHRALARAELAQRILPHLLSRIADLGPVVLEQITSLVSAQEWPARLLFVDALASEQGGTARATKRAHGASPAQFIAPLSPNASLTPVTDAEVHELFAPTGPFLRRVATFERREQQVAMSLAVAATLRDGGQLLVEAGTGTGKSLAYLAPAVLHAVRNNDRVVVSTNTINLQDQLVQKDVPALAEALRKPFRAAVVKGRNNYLCLMRWAEFHRRALTPLESRVVVKVLIWSSATANGDIAELNLVGEEAALWWQICCTRETCIGDACAYKQRNLCHLFNARRQAEAAHLVIVNHALLLADLASDNQVLPEYTNLIIDEAHHLEDQATDQLGFEVDGRAVARLFNDIVTRSEGGTATGLAEMLGATVGRRREPERRVGRRAEELVRQTERARQRLRAFLSAVRTFLTETRQDDARREQEDATRRVVAATRAQPGWTAVEAAWDDLGVLLSEIQRSLEELHRDLALVDAKAVDGLDTLLQTTLSISQQVANVRVHTHALVSEPDDGAVYWIVTSEADHVSLHSAPLDVADLLESMLFAVKRSVVLTSATLTVNGNFGYVRERLGLDRATRAERIGSPFDYQRQVLVYVPDDVPEPGQDGYQAATEEALLNLVTASAGRALVLFTSHAALRATHSALKRKLAHTSLSVVAQNIDGSRTQLLAMLKNLPNTVVLGTSSFWEGVDVAGPALSALAIVRLPFTVPSDPVFAARSEQFDSPFGEYAVPQAVLRFTQGFGRLIRTATDRGIVVVLDRRVISKAYGQVFQRSVPQCEWRRGRVAEIGPATQEWLGG